MEAVAASAVAAAARGSRALNHRVDGPDGAPVVVLSHALGSSLEMWRPQVGGAGNALPRAALRHAGPRRSPAPPGPYAIADLVADQLALLDELGIDAGLVRRPVAWAARSACCWRRRRPSGWIAWCCARPRRSSVIPRAGWSARRRCAPGHGSAGGWSDGTLVHPRVRGARAGCGGADPRDLRGDGCRGLRGLLRGDRGVGLRRSARRDHRADDGRRRPARPHRHRRSARRRWRPRSPVRRWRSSPTRRT